MAVEMIIDNGQETKTKLLKPQTTILLPEQMLLGIPHYDECYLKVETLDKLTLFFYGNYPSHNWSLLRQTINDFPKFRFIEKDVITKIKWRPSTLEEIKYYRDNPQIPTPIPRSKRLVS